MSRSPHCLDQGFPTCKIILVMAENTNKGVKIKTQKQSYEVLVYKEKLM
jgi:hypothetical protein